MMELFVMKIMRYNIINLEIFEGVDICGKGFDINFIFGCFFC